MSNITDVVDKSPDSGDQSRDIDSFGLTDQKFLLEIERLKDDNSHRNELVRWVEIVVILWLFFVMIVLFSNTSQLHLSDTVLVTLLGTTTLNVLGLMVIILGDLFKNKGNASKDN